MADRTRFVGDLPTIANPDPLAMHLFEGAYLHHRMEGELRPEAYRLAMRYIEVIKSPEVAAEIHALWFSDGREPSNDELWFLA